MHLFGGSPRNTRVLRAGRRMEVPGIEVLNQQLSKKRFVFLSALPAGNPYLLFSPSACNPIYRANADDRTADTISFTFL